MAFLFNGSTHTIRKSTAPLASAYPLTMFGRIRLVDFTVTSSNHVIVKLLPATSGWGYSLTVEFVSSAWKARAFSAVALGNSASSTTAIADNNWHTAMGEWTSDTARQVWLDNGGNASNTGSTSPGTPTRSMLGSNETTGGTLAANVGHEIADVAVWAGTLAAADRAALQAGISPMLVRPDILKLYWPGLVGANDWRGDPFTTITGATAVRHPMVYMPAPPRIIGVSSPNVTVALTGQSLTGAVGTLLAATSLALSGGGFSVSQGLVQQGVSVGPTGLALSTGQGSVTSTRSSALIGQPLNTISGTLTPAYSLGVSGQPITSSIGLFTASLSLGLSGNTTALAQTGISVGRSALLTGQSTLVQMGVIAPVASIAPTGLSVISVQGVVASVTTLEITGQEIFSAKGLAVVTTAAPTPGSRRILAGVPGSRTIGPVASVSRAITGKSSLLADRGKVS